MKLDLVLCLATAAYAAPNAVANRLQGVRERVSQAIRQRSRIGRNRAQKAAAGQATYTGSYGTVPAAPEAPNGHPLTLHKLMVGSAVIGAAMVHFSTTKAIRDQHKQSNRKSTE